MRIGDNIVATYSQSGQPEHWLITDHRIPQPGETYVRSTGTVTHAPANTIRSPRFIVEPAGRAAAKVPPHKVPQHVERSRAAVTRAAPAHQWLDAYDREE